MRRRKNQADLVCTGIDAQIPRNTDEPGIIIVAVLYVVGYDIQTVELRTLVGRYGCDVRPPGFRYDLGRDGRILAYVYDDILMLF